MAKKTLFTIGILSVLFLSFTLVSSAPKNGFEISIIGTGATSDNRISGNPGDKINFTVQFNNSNSTYPTINLSLSGTDITSKKLTITGNETFQITFTIPNTQETQSRTLNGIVNSSNQIIAEIEDGVYYTVNSEIISGCTDPNANNYNPNATEDDGSCTYDSIPSNYKFCDDFAGDKGHLEIAEFDVINNGKGDDTEWEYLDEIEIEATIENTGDENINNVLVEIKILDENDNEISRRKINLDDDKIDLGRIGDGDEETATFKISEVPIDLDTRDYRIYVRAYDERNEETECASTSSDFTNDDETYFEFSIIPTDGATVIVKEDLENVQASCGDKNVEVNFKVYNIGNSDEKKVLIMLENSELGISEKLVIDNLRDRKSKEATFFISIPQEVNESFVKLDIYTYYDYDNDEDELDELVAYGESSLAEGNDFSILLEILSCKKPIDTKIQVSLESEAIINEKVIIKATITNNGDDNDFIISTSGLESWAESISISPLTASIKKGETSEVIITFVPTKIGEHTFEINAIANGETNKQTVIINIKESPNIFSKINNTTLYIFTAILAVLIIIFLALIIKVSRRKNKPQF